jgi:putative transposase
VTVLIQQACEAGARLERACAVLQVSPRTLQRWREEGEVKADGRQGAAQERTSANRLSEAERQHLLEVANRPEFASKPPSQIVPTLADQGEYLASESSFYRCCGQRSSWLTVARPRSRPIAVRNPW